MPESKLNVFLVNWFDYYLFTSTMGWVEIKVWTVSHKKISSNVDQRIRLRLRRAVHFDDGRRLKTREVVDQLSERKVAAVVLSVDCDALGALADATLTDSWHCDDALRTSDAVATGLRRRRRHPCQGVQVDCGNFVSLRHFLRRRFSSLQRRHTEHRQTGNQCYTTFFLRHRQKMVN